MSKTTQTYNPTINPRTGDYEIEKGDTVPDYSVQFAAYVRMKVKRKLWLYAPDDSYGSDFYKVLKRSFNTPRVLETMTAKALQPLIDDKRASEITAFSKPLTRNMCNIEVSIVETNRTIQTFEFNPVE